MIAERTFVQLVYEGVDITRDVHDDLLSFEWTDNESGKADDISITLKNNHGLWLSSWYPKKGDAIVATIITDGGEEGRRSIRCGRFEIDELSFSGPPSTVSIKAQSAPMGNDVRKTKRSKAWEDVSLEDVAASIAQTAGLILLYDVPESFLYDRLDQRRESDLAFLNRVCKDEGLSLKLTDQQLVVFSEEEYENKMPVDEIELGASPVISWSFDSKAYELVKEVVVRYRDPRKGETVERVVEAPKPPPKPPEEWATIQWFLKSTRGDKK